MMIGKGWKFVTRSNQAWTCWKCGRSIERYGALYRQGRLVVCVDCFRKIDPRIETQR